MHKTVWLLYICLHAALSHAQSTSTLVGARAAAVAYASGCLGDEWSIFNNPGGLAAVDYSAVAFTHDVRSELKAWNRTAAAAVRPLKFGTIGAGVYRFGDDLYNEQILAAAYASRFGLASLGFKISYVQYSADGFGSTGKVTLNFGGIAQLTPALSIGAHIVNINQARITTPADGETIPTILLIGFSIKASDKFFVSTEIEKDISYAALFKAGAEYKLNPKVFFRTGFNINPDAAFFGMGFRPKKIAVDYAFTYNMNIGVSHQATIAYQWRLK